MARLTDALSDKPKALEPARLVAIVDGAEVGRLELTRGTALVGSEEGNDLVIDHRTVSRRHLEVSLQPGGVHVKDPGSTNGTRYHGAKVREVLVPFGAVLEVGKAVLRVESARQVDEARFGPLASRSKAMIEAIGDLQRAARTELTVLLEGETGTGKEVAARAVHLGSARAKRPFEVVDCGALPRELAGSELFGHVRGAFTGADRDHPGAFERAQGGTLFLDEVGELPLELQPLLLRALESREVRRVGAAKFEKIDVRIVAATNRDLDAEVAAGRFRRDLLHRLGVVRVKLPPLRERPEDLPLLARAIVDAQPDARAGAWLSPETLRALAAYAWPGNIRELKNVIDRAVAMGEGPELPAPAPGGAAGFSADYHEARRSALDAFERDFVAHLLRRCGKNVSKAAQEAGIDRVYLHKLLKRHGIDPKKL